MANTLLEFPPQQTLSIKETISTDLPQFIPHHEVIFMGLTDLFQNKLGSLSASDQSYLDSLKCSNDNDKAIASEIARWHNQIEYAKDCVADIENNALCKRMQLILSNVGEDRKQLKDADALPFAVNDEYKFVLLDYNLQTFPGATSDSNAIDVLLKTGLQNMKNLVCGGKCCWRWHLIYAQLLCRISLDNNGVEQQINAAQSKLGSDANSHYAYLALTGDLYVKMRQFDKARTALSRACGIMQNDGYCRTRLIYSYLYEKDFNKAAQIWSACCNDLKSSGCDTALLDSYTNYMNMYMSLDDEKNNEAIMSWSGEDKLSYLGTALKLFVLAYKSGKFVGDDKFGIVQVAEFANTSAWTEKNSDLAQEATHFERMVASFIKFFVDMFSNDDIENWDMQGPVLDNVFSSFPRPVCDDILDALSLESYLLGMFKLRWKGDCKNAFRFSIICNCRLNMNSYIGEVIGFQNAGSSDIAVEKIKEIQKLVNVEALELMPIDAKRMNLDDEKNTDDAAQQLIAIISKNNENYDAMLALADIYICGGKWQAALLLMQQAVEYDCKACNKNLELRMKWGVILFFNGFLPLANQIFREYATKDFEASAHGYYCGIAANIFYELGRNKDLDKMEAQEKIKGSNIWSYRYLCFKYWVEFFVKKKKKKKAKQPKSGGKSQYDKAIDCAKKIIRLDEKHPLGHALLARSNIELLDTVDGMKERIVDSVAKSVSLADALLAKKEILARIYYECLVHCGVAMYQIGEDGDSYYKKACHGAPHGETVLMKLQRQRIVSTMDTQQIRELLIEIQSKHLNMKDYKKALPLFEFDVVSCVNGAAAWDLFTEKGELPETGLLGMNITKPDVQPNGDKKPKKKAKKKAVLPDTDDAKGYMPPPAPPAKSRASPDVYETGGVCIESVFKYANLCSNSWPAERLTFSLPFDDAMQMGQALTMLLRKEMAKTDGMAPSDELDLIGRLHWGGEQALQYVIDACQGKSDGLHLGLANFAFTYKVEEGIGSDEHKACTESMMNVTKNLSYEGKVGFAALRGLQCVSFEADELFKQVSTLKDADGSDWLFHRHYGQYLLVIKHDYSAACKALENAYKSNARKDPMTVGWYMAALSKCNVNNNNTAVMERIFDEIGKYHQGNTDAAVIRAEFLHDFDIKTPDLYDSLCKSGPTAFMQARKLICTAKYERAAIGADINSLCKAIKPSKSNNKLYRILTAYFTSQAQYIYNNSLRQCIEGMTKAGTISMDWTLGNALTAYCFAKKNDWESAMNSIDPIPTKLYDAVILQCASMLSDSVSEDIEMNKQISAQMFIGRINNLRFIAKKSDEAWKELIDEYLCHFKHDFNGLVTLADIWLSRGAYKCAYFVYFRIYKLFPVRYGCNFILRLKFAECMRLNGLQSESLAEFRDVYGSFDHKDKGIGEELSAMSDLLLGYALLCLSVGDFETAEMLLKKSNRRHILHKLASAHLTLLSQGDVAAVYDDFKEECGDNPLLLACVVRAGKLIDADVAGLESKLKGLIGGKYGQIAVVKEYCELSAGFGRESRRECLTNNILAKGADVGVQIYKGLKAIYARNNCPSARDIFSVGIDAVDGEDIGIICKAKPAQMDGIGGGDGDYAVWNKEAMKEIEAIKSGQFAAGKKKGGGNVKKRKSVKSLHAAAGTKPKVDYGAVALSERKKWAFQMCDNLPTPRSREVASWSAQQIGDFIAKIPIFGLNEWYGNKFKECGVSGKMFLDCNEDKLIGWGIDRKCHRARFRAEALAMKRRG